MKQIYSSSLMMFVLCVFQNNLGTEVPAGATVTINIDNSSGQYVQNGLPDCKCVKYFGKKLKECMKTLSPQDQKKNFLAMTEAAQNDYIKSLNFKEHIELIILFENKETTKLELELIDQKQLILQVYQQRNKLSPDNTFLCALFFFSIIPARECDAAGWLKLLENDYQYAKKEYFERKEKQ